jgi:hypothetical protein
VVPLPSGAIAAFKIPFPMSEEDFDHYKKLLVEYKPAIVKKATEAPDSDFYFQMWLINCYMW